MSTAAGHNLGVPWGYGAAVTHPADQDPEGLDPVERARRAEPPVMPTAEEAAAELDGAGPPPTTLNLARSVWIAAAVMGLVHSALALINKNRIADALVELNTNSTITADQLRSSTNTLLWTMLIGAVGFGVFYVLLAFKAREGVRRARTILAGLAVISVLFYYALSVNFYGLFTALLALVGTVLLFLPKSSRYFREVEAA